MIKEKLLNFILDEFDIEKETVQKFANLIKKIMAITKVEEDDQGYFVITIRFKK